VYPYFPNSCPLALPWLVSLNLRGRSPELSVLIQLNCQESRPVVVFFELLVSALELPRVEVACIARVSATELPTELCLYFFNKRNLTV
jgi:hypothetical protein